MEKKTALRKSYKAGFNSLVTEAEAPLFTYTHISITCQWRQNVLLRLTRVVNGSGS